mmetsp:Transcript_64839/g.90209  ORF Transcript_64839/g.90209 Transcript_64839/m.90209 type:complete len:85 (+) Transcript_64839:161-415(+)
MSAGLCNHLPMFFLHMPKLPPAPSMKQTNFHQQVASPSSHVTACVCEILTLLRVDSQVPSLIVKHFEFILQLQFYFTLFVPAAR